MRKIRFLCLCLCLCLLGALGVSGCAFWRSDLDIEPGEKEARPLYAGPQKWSNLFLERRLPLLVDAANWSAEGGELSQVQGVNRETPGMRFQVKANHQENGGMGWPNAYAGLAELDVDFMEFDQLQVWMRANLGRNVVRDDAVQLSFHSSDGGMFVMPLGRDLWEKSGSWIPVRLPIADLCRGGRLIRMGLDVGAELFREGQTLTVDCSGFELHKFNRCVVSEMMVRPARVFAGDEWLSVELLVHGPEESVAQGVPMELRRNGDAVFRKVVPVKAGRQTIRLQVTETKLYTGMYQLTAFPDDEERRVEFPVRVIESPYRDDNEENLDYLTGNTGL